MLLTDTVSGTKAERPGLDEILNQFRPGDVFVVWRLDRPGRALPHLIETVRSLNDHAVYLRSLTEQIDTGGSVRRAGAHLWLPAAEQADQQDTDHDGQREQAEEPLHVELGPV